MTYLKIAPGVEVLTTLTTLVPRFAAMELLVLAQVGSLLECQVAVCALVGAIVGVGEKMVDESMPDIEHLAAEAVEQSEESLGARFLELDHEVVCHIRDAQLVQV